MIETIIGLAPFGVIIMLAGGAVWFLWKSHKSQIIEIENQARADLKIVKDTADAQARPFSGAKSANRWLSKRRDR